MRAAASRSTSIFSPLGNVVDCLGFSLLRKENRKKLISDKKKKKKKKRFDLPRHVRLAGGLQA